MDTIGKGDLRFLARSLKEFLREAFFGGRRVDECKRDLVAWCERVEAYLDQPEAIPLPTCSCGKCWFGGFEWKMDVAGITVSANWCPACGDLLRPEGKRKRMVSMDAVYDAVNVEEARGTIDAEYGLAVLRRLEKAVSRPIDEAR